MLCFHIALFEVLIGSADREETTYIGVGFAHKILA
jgi:hypothetical protein